MGEQSAFDFGGKAQDTIERVFIGLMLPPEAAAAAMEVGRQSRDQFGLRGAPIPAERSHVTLVHVGDYANRVPPALIADLTAALDALPLKAVDIVFDRVGSFAGAPGKHPHVLLGDAGVEALRAMREPLFEAVRSKVRTLSGPAFNPHVTLTYGDVRLPERPVTPIAWRATELLLIHSEVGRSRYNTLGRWMLD